MAKAQVAPNLASLEAFPLTCVECKNPMQEKHAIWLAAEHKARPLGLVVCSRECYQANVSRALKRKVCPVCGSQFDPPNTAGRPRQYCSPKCQREREKAYAKAIRRLAKGVSGDPREPNWDDSASIGEYIGRLEADKANQEMLLTRILNRRPGGEQGRVADEAALPADIELSLLLVNTCKATIVRLRNLISSASRRQSELLERQYVNRGTTEYHHREQQLARERFAWMSVLVEDEPEPKIPGGVW